MINLLTLITLGCLLLAVGVLYICRWRAFAHVVKWARQPCEATLPQDRITPILHPSPSNFRDTTPQASLILPSLNDGWWMERNLKYWLEQRFPNFEVIVADASDEAEDETANVVKRLQQEHPHLRYTRVPLTHRNIHPRKLALTLGVRAARAPWVVILPPDGSPENRDWLARIAQHFHQEVDVVMGYLNYDDSLGAPGRRAVYQSAKRFAQQAETALQGKPIGCCEGNVALRRDWLLEVGGFVDSLEIPYGECTLLVDARVETGRAAIELHPEATVRRRLPDANLLEEERRQQEEIYDRLHSRKTWVFLRENLADFFTYFSFVVTFVYLALRGLYFQGAVFSELQSLEWLQIPSSPPSYEWFQVAYDLPAVVLVGILLVAPILAANRWCKALGERPFGTYTWTYDMLRPWRSNK